MRKISRSCIIDDDPIFVFGTKKVMKEVDFCDDILVYHNGEEAINGLKSMVKRGEQLPNLIFLDLNMPIMDGWDFLEDFIAIPNNNRKDVFVYIISSSIDANDFIRARNYEIVNNYILKPVTPEDLIFVLNMLPTG
ncbi:MAG: response regulator [Flavobacteriaceae bacterium]|nr:response regulator [Flavobacteriaceae bacterium]MDG2414988.1 response regulator [Flavobacteriaceae bacterium]